eukprot:6196000-Pleurochrysis_carterae.AAC.1
MLNLTRQKLTLDQQLKSQAEIMELRVDAVKAKVAAGYQTLLHAQFMQGLAAGSAMASQGTMQVPGVTPFQISLPHAATVLATAPRAALKPQQASLLLPILAHSKKPILRMAMCNASDQTHQSDLVFKPF